MRKKAFGLRSFFLFSLSAFPIRISELGPVQTGRPPPGERERMGVGVFMRLQHTLEIRQWDPRAENWVPICASMWDQNPRLGPGSPGDRAAVRRDLLSGLLGTIQRVGPLCFW